MPKKQIKSDVKSESVTGKPETGPVLFCSVCGKKRVTTVSVGIGRYDIHTGHPMLNIASMCPDRFDAENERQPLFGVLRGMLHDSDNVGELDNKTGQKTWYR